jgi:mRNA-degrading endonuclease RelE of RelBE toxin-antitoxin system
MAEIESVEVSKEWIHRDFSSSGFTKEEQQMAADAFEEVQDQLVTWDRPVRNAMKQIEHQGDKTIYRHRKGHLRLFFIRKGDTLYWIGVGKRDVIYDRDISIISKRADNHPPG